MEITGREAIFNTWPAYLVLADKQRVWLTHRNLQLITALAIAKREGCPWVEYNYHRERNNLYEMRRRFKTDPVRIDAGFIMLNCKRVTIHRAVYDKLPGLINP